LVAEALVPRAELQVRQGIGPLTAEAPIVDPGIERCETHPRLTHATTGVTFGRVMGRCRRHGCVPQPNGLIAPTRLLRDSFQRAAKQRPLHAELAALIVLEIGSDVPPFDAKAIVRTVICREAEFSPGHYRCEYGGVTTQTCEAFLVRRGVVAAAQQNQ
jgi:hypothetical protein